MYNVVEEIINKGLEVMALELPTYSQLDYSYALENNNCANKSSRFGFTPNSAVFVNGRQMGFTTMDHLFNIILVNSYANIDDDIKQRATVNSLYTDMQKLISIFNKQPFILPTPENKVLLISGAAIEEVEFIDDNSVAVLRATINIRYYYKI